MSRELIPSHQVRLPAISGSRLPRRVERRVQAAHHAGLETSARINAAAYATHVAVTLTAALSAEEERLIRQAPLGEPRYQAIIDSFASLACSEIVRLGL